MIKRINKAFVDQYKHNIQKSLQTKGLEVTKASIRKDLSNPDYIALFAYLVFPHYFYRPFKDTHYRLLEHLEIGKRHKRNKATKAYRGCGKTSIQVMLQTVYETCYKIHPYVAINSYSDDTSRDKLKLVKDEFEENTAISWLYGKPITDKANWNKSDITVFGDVRIKTISTGQNPRGLLEKGSRPTKIISDDIIDDEDVLNPDIRDKALNWYKKALEPALSENGVMELLNTPLHPEDIVETIFKGQPPFHTWDKLMLPAMIDGKSVDEDWKSTKRLLEMSLDTYTFSQEYMCKPLEERIKGAYYEREIDRLIEQGRYSEQYAYVPSIPVDTYWDLAVSHDLNSVWFVQKISKTEYRFVDYWQGTGMSTNEIAEVIFSKPYMYGRHYAPHDINKTHAGETANKTLMQMYRNSGLHFSVVGSTTKASGIKATRGIFPYLYFYAGNNIAQGFNHLKSYRAVPMTNTDGLTKERHDVHSHAADALRYFSVQETLKEVDSNKPIKKRISEYARSQ